jgi:carboxymethylenebutenolidase
MPNERWTIKTTDGEFDAYVAKPEGAGPWPGVVVIQEIFGLNFVVREVCDRLASQGFLAVAPDLFWRIQPGIDITDKTQAEWDLAFGYYQAFDVDAGVRDIQATIDKLRADHGCTGKVGTVGYCLGGHLAFLTATRTDADAAVGYYGVSLETRLEEAVNHPLMLHIAGEDQFVSHEAQAQIHAALDGNPLVVIHDYPGRDHAFARPEGKHFHAEDAAAANARTLAFLREKLA